MGYDQWKTASPYDDEPDPIEEGERFMKDNAERRKTDVEIDRACLVIWFLLNTLEEI